ncbi:hypothetical protein G7090_16450 [Leclercia sp. 29361]|uniref:hypothetical protein n=1 Tax=Leclercia sp. 29361 TaxID=2714951 RepID=UPI00140DB190|nr:hypothetical protein [Leclercia sp. 29361]QIK14875.1 hypothetical protein G7090_16450 [Leclercia sp. 29361]
MSNIDVLSAKLKAAAQDEIMCREACDTSDLWQDVASPENVLALTEALEDYKAAYEEEARDKEVQRAVIDDALCKLLPGIQYMDPPDGGSVTPLEQVRRMVADYRERLKIAESRCDHRSKFWDVSGVQRCTLCDKAISSDGDQQVAELVAAGIITKVGE